MSGHGDSKKVVIAALAGNLAIAVCKFGAAYMSESTATLAEAVHSLADSGNQALLLVGMRLAIKPVDADFAFGRSAEKYFWPFVVALILFSVGGAFGAYEGITHIAHAQPTAGSRLWSYGVLGVSLFFESLSCRVAYKEFQVLAKGRPWKQALTEARDPTIPLVLAEDLTALLGLAIAFFAVLLSDVTKQPFWDPLGSIFIGVLLAVVAVVLAKLTHGLLIGRSATAEEQGHVLHLTERAPGVARVTQLLSMHLGPDAVIIALKVAFTPGSTVEQAEEITNDVERRIRAELPHMRKIFIEVDSRGDGRGLELARRAYSPANPVPLSPECQDIEAAPDSGKTATAAHNGDTRGAGS
jgi:cation diffusion facilitator family transporter